MKGLGLLPIDTVFLSEKTRTRVHGTFTRVEGTLSNLCGIDFEGYEIHMGDTDSKGNPLTNLTDTTKSDNVKEDGNNVGNIYGTYVHGIFDMSGVVNSIVEALLKEKGYDATDVHALNIQEYKETQYNLLADAIRKNLDMEAIYQIMEQGV